MSSISSAARRTILDVVLSPFFENSYYGRRLRGWVVFVTIVSAIAGVIIGVIYGGMQWDISNTQAYCNTLNGRSGMRTEFIQTSAFDWDCYAVTPSGKLVPTSQITYFVGKAK